MNEVRLASGPEWKCLSANAWWPAIPRLTFALGPGECHDARTFPTGWDSPDFNASSWPFAVPVAQPEHWGKLRPRSIPLLDEREIIPERCLGVFAGDYAADEERYCIRSIYPNGVSPITGIYTQIYSPEDQEIEVGASSANIFLNGRQIPFTCPSGLYLRREYRFSVQKGWNTFLALQEGYGCIMDFLLGLPRNLGLKVQADSEDATRGLFLVSEPIQAEMTDLELELGSNLSVPSDWLSWRGDETVHTPFADRTWKRLTPIKEAADILDTEGCVNNDRALVLLYEFKGEVSGRPILDFTASLGTKVDILYTERLENGQALHGYQDTHLAERYIAREGRQKWQTMHPRGMRYLEVVVSGDPANFELHRLALSCANYPVEKIGSFECSDPVMNRIWKLARDTQEVCMEDVFTDCPWRERALYVGDMFVQFQNTLAAHGDRLLMKHCIDLLFQTQDESGLLAPCSHGLPNNRHPDYSCVAVQAFWLYWARTGDIDFVRVQKDRLVRLTAGLQAIEEPGLNLLDGNGRIPYVDSSYFDKEGISCALNCFHQRAFFDAGQLFELIGEKAHAAHCFKHAAEIKRSIRSAFFDIHRGLFLDRRCKDRADTEASVPGNTLAVLFDIAKPSEQFRILEFLVERVSDNFRKTPPVENSDCNVTSYFSFYTLDVLFRHGRAVEAEQFIRDYWGQKLDQGAVTCWEYFVPICSLSHAWSAHPMHYLSTRVLGVEYVEPGNPNRIRISPNPGNLEWARGVYPHPRGPIRISWERKNSGPLVLDYEVPEVVEVIIDDSDDEKIQLGNQVHIGMNSAESRRVVSA